jgi:hypothetical protein
MKVTKMGRNVARMEEINASMCLLETLQGRDHLERICIDGKIILDWMLDECGGKV